MSPNINTVWLEDIYEKINKKLTAECIRLGDRIPYISDEGVYKDDMRYVRPEAWTNGFWAGMLWQAYNATGSNLYRETAEKSEEALDKALEDFEGLHHDVGFMWLHTSIANYRLTQNKKSRKRGIHAATVLAGRFNPIGNYISAWNLDKKNWMIIDCLMNIPLLYWAGRELEDPRFIYVANTHADTAKSVLMRDDGSCHHIAVFNPETGVPEKFPAGQGYSEGSSWSRGQACRF